MRSTPSQAHILSACPGIYYGLKLPKQVPSVQGCRVATLNALSAAGRIHAHVQVPQLMHLTSLDADDTFVLIPEEGCIQPSRSGLLEQGNNLPHL